MSDKTTIDPDGARSTNARFRATTSTFDGAVTRMADIANSYNGCWGSDKFGQAFAKGYVPGANDVIKYSGQVRDGIRQTADNVETSIKNFENVDQNNANSM
jgi:hypothetical protein